MRQTRYPRQPADVEASKVGILPRKKNPVLPQPSPRGGRTCGNLCRRGVGAVDAPTGGGAEAASALQIAVRFPDDGGADEVVAAIGDVSLSNWTVRPSSGCSVVLATHTAGVSVDGYTLILAANPWNIVRTYNLTPGQKLLGCVQDLEPVDVHRSCRLVGQARRLEVRPQVQLCHSVRRHCQVHLGRAPGALGS